MLPFGNGAERMLENKTVNAHINQIDLNIHSAAHIFRASRKVSHLPLDMVSIS
jgi:xylulokinase